LGKSLILTYGYGAVEKLWDEFIEQRRVCYKSTEERHRSNMIAGYAEKEKEKRKYKRVGPED
jgi:hypothetical protein